MKLFIQITFFALLFVSSVFAFNFEDDPCFPGEFELGMIQSYNDEMYLSAYYRSVPKGMIVFDVTSPSNWTKVIGRGWLVNKTQKIYYSDYATGKCIGKNYKIDGIKKLCIKNMRYIGESKIGNEEVVTVKGTILDTKVMLTGSTNTHKLLSLISKIDGDIVEKTVHNYNSRISHPLIFVIPRKCFNNENRQVPDYFMNLVKNYKPFV